MARTSNPKQISANSSSFPRGGGSAVRFRPQPRFRFEPHELVNSRANACHSMKYDWKDAGEEWSAPWGTSAAQWFGAILPRVRAFLPAETILEIAPGFGRWTYYLKDYCQELWIVDRA